MFQCETTSAIERVLLKKPNSAGQRKCTFPDEFSTHVHQICLTYLVPEAPFRINLDYREMAICTKKAAISPIPATVFDDLLDLVIENLYYDVFPRYMLYEGIEPGYDNSQPATRPLTPIEEFKEDELLEDVESLSVNDFSFQVDVPNRLSHQTSQIFDFMRSTASSIYSDVDLSDGEMDELDTEFDSNFYSLMNSHGTKYSQTIVGQEEESYFDLDDSSGGRRVSSLQDSNSKTLSVDSGIALTEAHDKNGIDAINMIFDTYQTPTIEIPAETKFNVKSERIKSPKSDKNPKHWKSLLRNSFRGTFMR